MSNNKADKRRSKPPKKSDENSSAAAAPVTPSVSFDDPFTDVLSTVKEPADSASTQDDRSVHQAVLDEKQRQIDALENERQDLVTRISALGSEKDAVLAEAKIREKALTEKLAAANHASDAMTAKMEQFMLDFQEKSKAIVAEREQLKVEISERDLKIAQLVQSRVNLESKATESLKAKNIIISELQVELDTLKVNQADVSAEGNLADSADSLELTRVQAELKTALAANDYLSNCLNEKATELWELQSQQPAAPASSTLAPASAGKAKQRELEAYAAIKHLRNAITPADTKADKARMRIINCLEQAFNETDPDAYFKANQAYLNKDLKALGTWGSLFNTAVNAILAVAACLSVVGITLLSLTGNLQTNREKSGSAFAFTMFADRQKAQRDVHTVVAALTDGPRCGG